MKDVQKTMTKTQSLNDIKMMFGLYSKINKFDEIEFPFIYNFISAGKWFLFIKRNKQNKYDVCGKTPFKVAWTEKQYDNYADIYDTKDSLKEAKDTYYILLEKLIRQVY